jgi:hypothetical protein
MPVPAERRPEGEVDAHLDDLSPRGGEIVSLKIGALDARLLRRRVVERRQATCGKRSDGDGEEHRFHFTLPVRCQHA